MIENILKKLLIIFVIVLFYRHFSYWELDDLHPLKKCSNKYIDKSRYLWIIPIYKGVQITDHPEWCKNIKQFEKQGKILGLHGITHEPEDWIRSNTEFSNDISKNKIKLGEGIFEKAFGYKPKIFKPPCYMISSSNKKK